MRNSTPSPAERAALNVAVNAANIHKLLAAIAAGGTADRPMIEGEGIEFYDGVKIRVPNGATYASIRATIDRAEKEAETPTEWIKWYDYRFNDGAHALMQVLKARYGGAFGEVTPTFWGPERPRLVSIDIAYGQTAQIPMGKLSLPAMPGLNFNAHSARNHNGNVFVITAEGPRKYAAEIEALFAAVGDYLKTNSIYRGKAVVGVDDLKFMNLATIRRHEIVFARAAEEMLETTVWGPIRNAQWLREENIPLKRAALLAGPYGTGKTSAGLITALIGVEAGWTVLHARTGVDSIEDVLTTARLYQPAVVVIEDIDGETATSNAADVSKFLEAFDGATAKGSEIVLVMTTNHLERIHRGMLRPGRVDAVIQIESLDPEGVERLIKAVVPADKRAADIDYAEVAREMAGFYPAFVREAVDRARVVAITTHGSRSYVLDTDSLRVAARGLRAQLDVLEAAGEGDKRPTLDEVFRTNVRESLLGLKGQGGRDDFYMVEPGSNEDDAE